MKSKNALNDNPESFKSIKDKIKKLDCTIMLNTYSTSENLVETDRKDELENIIKNLTKNSKELIILTPNLESLKKITDNNLFNIKPSLEGETLNKIFYLKDKSINIKCSTIDNVGNVKFNNVIIYIPNSSFYNLNRVKASNQKKVNNLNALKMIYQGLLSSKNYVHFLIPVNFLGNYTNAIIQKNLKLTDRKITIKNKKQNKQFNRKDLNQRINRINNLNKSIILVDYKDKKENLDKLVEILNYQSDDINDLLILNLKNIPSSENPSKLKVLKGNLEEDKFYTLDYPDSGLNIKYSSVNVYNGHEYDNIILYIKFEENLDFDFNESINFLDNLIKGLSFGRNNVFILVPPIYQEFIKYNIKLDLMDKYKKFVDTFKESLPPLKDDVVEFNRYMDKLNNLEFYINHKKEVEFKSKFNNLFTKVNEFSSMKFVYNFNLSSEIKEFQKKYENINLDSIIENLNKKYIEKELNLNKDYFDDINGFSLDRQQREVVVTDEDNTQIVAGAGSGKTLTLVAKVKYLIEKKGLKPKDILILSYSNASVDDLNKKLPSSLKATTFHKLGNSILSENGLPTNPNVNPEDIIKDYFKNNVINNQELCDNIIEFFAYYYFNKIKKSEASSIGEVYDMEEGRDYSSLRGLYGGDNEKITMENKTVRSFEELIIANYLFMHGINYEYEKEYFSLNNLDDINDFLQKIVFDDYYELFPYKIKKPIIDELMDHLNISEKTLYHYKPDFYLPDYDIYIEHFGVNKKCEANWLSSRDKAKYKKQINLKRNLHKDLNTTLVETYSYYTNKNRLTIRLREKLEVYDVKFEKIDTKELIRKILERDRVNKFKKFIELILEFINLFKGKNYKIEKFEDFKKKNLEEPIEFNKIRTKLFLDITKEVYKEYEDYLKRKDKIDFNDMINNATRLVKKGKFDREYKYIFVDEFQDISYTRYQLIKTIQNKTQSKIWVVGDDWQSIYRFAGSDISIFTEFNKYFNNPKIMRIEKTYRNSQELIDVSSNFIMKNDKQIKKSLSSNKTLKKPIKIVYYANENKNNNEQLKAFEYVVNRLSKESDNILVLGRNNKDIECNILRKFTPFNKKDENNKILNIEYTKNPDLNINYRSMHKAKGIEEDNVILINFENHQYGFPNQLTDDPVLEFVINKKDQFKFAEERRLFYVALTRTRNNTYILVPKTKKSEFIKEIDDTKFQDKIEIIDNGKFIENTEFDINKILEKNNPFRISTKLNCPKCKTGTVNLIIFKNKYGENVSFFGCSHYNCDWNGGFYKKPITLVDIKLLDFIKICRKCHSVMQVRKKKNYFLGCSNYSRNKCRSEGLNKKNQDKIKKIYEQGNNLKPSINQENIQKESLIEQEEYFPPKNNINPIIKEENTSKYKDDNSSLMEDEVFDYPKCVECGETRFFEEKGRIICRNCGLVVYEPTIYGDFKYYPESYL